MRLNRYSKVCELKDILEVNTLIYVDNRPVFDVASYINFNVNYPSTWIVTIIDLQEAIGAITTKAKIKRVDSTTEYECNAVFSFKDGKLIEVREKYTSIRP